MCPPGWPCSYVLPHSWWCLCQGKMTTYFHYKKLLIFLRALEWGKCWKRESSGEPGNDNWAGLGQWDTTASLVSEAQTHAGVKVTDRTKKSQEGKMNLMHFVLIIYFSSIQRILGYCTASIPGQNGERPEVTVLCCLSVLGHSDLDIYGRMTFFQHSWIHWRYFSRTMDHQGRKVKANVYFADGKTLFSKSYFFFHVHNYA